MKGLIIKSISGEYTVELENKGLLTCKPRGIFRHNNKLPKVGDIVTVDIDSKCIIDIDARKNDLVRPCVCNVDKVFLVFSVKEPDLNLNLLDRMIAVYEYNDINCIIVFTKLDLLEDKSYFNKIKEYYQSIGYTIYTSSFDFDISIIEEEIKNQICVFAGQSGVGKSTLLNQLGYDLKTDKISYALGRGKHTTRHVELMKVKDGYIADTPGFGLVDFEMDIKSLSHGFVEFFSNSSSCKYNGCTHVYEPKCKIKELVSENKILKSRYDNYLLFVEEIKQQKKKY